MQTYIVLWDCKLVYALQATRGRESGSVPWMVVTKIRVPNESVSSFLGDTGKLEQGRGRASSMVAFTAFVPWEQLHRPQNLCQTWSLPLRPSSKTSKEASFTERLGGRYTSIHCLCSTPGVGSLPRTISPIAIVLWDPGIQTVLATKARWSRGVSWAVSGKNQDTGYG